MSEITLDHVQQLEAMLLAHMLIGLTEDTEWLCVCGERAKSDHPVNEWAHHVALTILNTKGI